MALLFFFFSLRNYTSRNIKKLVENMGRLGYRFDATNSAFNLKGVLPFESISDFVYKHPKTKDCHFCFNAFLFF